MNQSVAVKSWLLRALSVLQFFFFWCFNIFPLTEKKIPNFHVPRRLNCWARKQSLVQPSYLKMKRVAAFPQCYNHWDCLRRDHR